MYLEIHLQAVIERDWTSTWRRSMDGAPGLNSSVSSLATVGMRQADFTFEALMENWLVAVDWEVGTPEDEATFRGQLQIVKMKGRQTILGVCCTWCMLHSVLTHDDGMER